MNSKYYINCRHLNVLFNYRCELTFIMLRGWYVGMCLQVIERGIGRGQHKQILAVYFPPLSLKIASFSHVSNQEVSIVSWWWALGKQSFQRQEALVAVLNFRSKFSKLRVMKMPIICENANYRSVSGFFSIMHHFGTWNFHVIAIFLCLEWFFFSMLHLGIYQLSLCNR